MNIKTLKRALVLIITCITMTGSVYAYSWNGSFASTPPPVYSGCDGVGIYVHFNNDAPSCNGTYNMTITMQHTNSLTAPISYTTVATQTKVSNFSSGAGDQMYFSPSVINTTGYYRFIVSGTPASGNSCGVTISTFTSQPSSLYTITKTPTLNFNINGTQAYAPSSFNVIGCEPVKLNYTGAGIVTSHIYSYKEVTSTGVTVIGGVSSSSGSISGAPTTISLSLPTSKYFDVTLQVSNGSCATSKTSRIYTNPTPPTPTAAFKVNGQVLSTNCATPTELYNCAAFNLTLSNQSTNATIYRLLVLHHATLACPSSSGASFNEVYNSGDLSALPTDLKNLPGFNGTYIQSNPGYYYVVLLAYGSCGSLGLNAGYMHITASPAGNAAFVTRTTTKSSGTSFSYNMCAVPYSTQVSYIPGGATNCGTGGVYTFPMESTNVANANPVGKTSTVLDFTSVTTGTSNPNYSITIKSDVWDAITLSWVNMNYQNIPETYDDGITIPLISLLEAGGSDPSYIYADYFSYASNGEIFRITVTVNNECGSKSQSQIIKLNTTSLRIAEAAGEMPSESAEHSLNVFPNPATSEVNFEVLAADKDKVNIAVYDLKGAHVMDIVTGAEATEGMNIYRNNLDRLTSGMYLYEVKVNNTIYKGKISKQ